MSVPLHRRDRTIVLALFAVALLLRVAHLVTAHDAPFFSILYIDPLMYDEWGVRIAGGRLLSERPFFLDPLYPYFLGLIYAVVGHEPFAIGIVQSLAGAFVPVLVYFPTRRWFDRPTATLAAAIAAVYLPAIYFGGLLMKPALSMVLLAAWASIVHCALERKASRSLWLACGIAFALTCLLRGNLLLAAPFVGGALLLRDGWGKPSRARLAEVGLALAGLLCVLVVPAAHNWAVGGQFVLTTTNAGANFYIGNNPANATGEYKQLPFVRANPKYEQIDFDREAERRAGRPLLDREVSAFWFAESWRWLRGKPDLWLRLLWTKTRAYWGAYEIPDSVDYYLFREYAPVLRLPVPGFGLLAPLSLLGAALAWRRKGWPRVMLVLLVVYCGTVVTFFVFSRFRAIVLPLLYVFAAHGALELWRRLHAWRDRRREALRPLVVAAALFVGFALFVNLPVRARTDTWSYGIASALRVPTREERSVQGHYNLGVAYAREAKDASDPDAGARRLAEAERELRVALEFQGPETETAKIHVELGKVLARLRRNREAIEIYAAGARIEPRDHQIHHALGILYEREGELDIAARSFAEALRVAPRHAESAVRLGRTLLQMGHPEEAARAFELALSVSPENPRALAGLEAIAAEGPPVVHAASEDGVP